MQDKDIKINKYHVDGIISSDEEQFDPNEPTDYVVRNIAMTD